MQDSVEPLLHRYTAQIAASIRARHMEEAELVHP
jgi:hypothetical protein